METLSHTDSKSMYSWWWGSHTSPKNSKWLQENITDVDTKVKQMIRLIEEDADSFARRAEMYYKKRPELMKLVEEFYKAYHSLAERYDHATGALQQAHRTIAEAFPNQISTIIDDSPTSEPDLHTPMIHHPAPRTLFGEESQKHDSGFSSSHLHGIKRSSAFLEGSNPDTSKKGLKQLNEMFRSGERVQSPDLYSEGMVRKGHGFYESGEKEKTPQSKNSTVLVEESHDFFREEKDLLGTISELKNKLQQTEMECALSKEEVGKAHKMISSLQVQIQRSCEEVDNGVMKLKCTEERCLQLERSNHSLESEVESLMEKMGAQTQQLIEKQQELDELWKSLQQERFRLMDTESAFQSLQWVYSECQEEVRSLSAEHDLDVVGLKEMEEENIILDGKIKKIKAENLILAETNQSFTMSLQKLNDEFFELREEKQVLVEEVGFQVQQKEALRRELVCIQEEKTGLNKKLGNILMQIESINLKPDCLESSIKELLEEKASLAEQLKNFEEICEKCLLLEKSVLDLSTEVERLKENSKELDGICESLLNEKCELIAEKSSLLSDLQVVNDDIAKLSQKNIFLNNSLSVAHFEVEGLKEKIKDLDCSLELIGCEKLNLIAEKNVLDFQFQEVCRKVEDTDKTYQKMEENHSCLEKEIIFALRKIEEISLSFVSCEKTSVGFVQSSEIRLDGLDAYVTETCYDLINKFHEEVDANMNAQIEGYVVKKCIQDLVENNLILIAKHDELVEESMAFEELLSVSESRNIQQKVEVECLHEQMKELFDKYSNEEIPYEKVNLNLILGEIQNYKKFLLQADHANLHMVIENSIFITLPRYLKFETSSLEMDDSSIIQNLGILEELLMIHRTNLELMQMNEESSLKLWELEMKELMLLSTVGEIMKKLLDSQRDAHTLNEKNFEQTGEINTLMNRLHQLEEEKCVFEYDSFVILSEFFYESNLTMIFLSYITEKSVEQKEFLEHLENLSSMNNVLRGSLTVLEGELEATKTENFHIKGEFKKSEAELKTLVLVRDQLDSEKSVVNQMNLEVMKMKEKLLAEQNNNVEWNRKMVDVLEEINKLNAVKEDQGRLIIKLTEDCHIRQKETEYLCDSVCKLNSEVCNFQDESENSKNREEKLKTDIEMRKIESELWEQEFTTFLHKLQESTVKEAIYEEKMNYMDHILCKILDENALKDSQIELMMETLATLQDKNGRLKSFGDICLQALYVLRECVSYLENQHNKKHIRLDVVNEMYKSETSYTEADERAAMELLEELQRLKTKITTMGEEGSEPRAASIGEEDSELGRDELLTNQVYPLKDGGDGVSFSEITEQKEVGVADKPGSFSSTERHGGRRKLFRMLDLDLQKLRNLQNVVRELKMKMEKKKGGGGMGRRVSEKMKQSEVEMKQMGVIKAEAGGRRVMLMDYLYGDLERVSLKRKRCLCGCVRSITKG